MEETAIHVLIGVAATLAIVGLLLTAKSGGFGNIGLGLEAAKRAGDDPPFAETLKAMLSGAQPVSKPTEPKPIELPKPNGVPLRMLAMLQAEARLVDFLMEDIQTATDEQIGQAVREVHRKAREALLLHAKPTEILAGTEGDTVTVPAGFDPSRIRVVGNVVGNPPFTGTLQHPGWRVNELKLNAPSSTDEFVLQPAEVQVQ